MAGSLAALEESNERKKVTGAGWGSMVVSWGLLG